MLAFDEIPAGHRTPEFFNKYEGKSEKVQLDEGVKKSVVLKLIAEEGQAP